MKLYEVPRYSKVRIIADEKAPPAHREFDKGEVLTFDHIDGMYSLCYDQAGQMVHPAAWTEVEVVSEYPECCLQGEH